MLLLLSEIGKAEDIYNEVIAAHPKYSLAHVLLMQNIESSEYKAMLPHAFAKMVNTDVDEDAHKEEMLRIRTALERVSQLGGYVINDMKSEYDELLAYYGLKSDTRPDASKIKT